MFYVISTSYLNLTFHVNVYKRVLVFESRNGLSKFTQMCLGFIRMSIIVEDWCHNGTSEVKESLLNKYSFCEVSRIHYYWHLRVTK